MQGDHKVNRQSIVAQDWQAVNLPFQPKRFGGHKALIREGGIRKPVRSHLLENCYNSLTPDFDG